MFCERRGQGPWTEHAWKRADTDAEHPSSPRSSCLAAHLGPDGFSWRGWLIWAALLFSVRYFRAAPIYDPTLLDPNRRFGAFLALLVFCFASWRICFNCFCGLAYRVGLPGAAATQRVPGLPKWQPVSFRLLAISIELSQHPLAVFAFFPCSGAQNRNRIATKKGLFTRCNVCQGPPTLSRSQFSS